MRSLTRIFLLGATCLADWTELMFLKRNEPLSSAFKVKLISWLNLCFLYCQMESLVWDLSWKFLLDADCIGFLCEKKDLGKHLSPLTVCYWVKAGKTLQYLLFPLIICSFLKSFKITSVIYFHMKNNYDLYTIEDKK